MCERADGSHGGIFLQNRIYDFGQAEDQEARISAAFDNLLETGNRDFRSVVSTHCVNGDTYQGVLSRLFPGICSAQRIRGK